LHILLFHSQKLSFSRRKLGKNGVLSLRRKGTPSGNLAEQSPATHTHLPFFIQLAQF